MKEMFMEYTVSEKDGTLFFIYLFFLEKVQSFSDPCILCPKWAKQHLRPGRELGAWQVKELCGYPHWMGHSYQQSESGPMTRPPVSTLGS